MNIINKAIQAIHGAYTISVKNIHSGKVYLAHCDNIPVIGFTTRLYSSASRLLFGTGSAVQLAIGNGSNEPSSSDTALSNQLWRVNSTGCEDHFSSDFRTYTCIHTFTIPASTSYVGNISELGIYMYASANPMYDTLITHSLLKDAEGHPYTITKSDLDEITITYSISVTYDSGISIPAVSWYSVSAYGASSAGTAIAALCEYGRYDIDYVPCLCVSSSLRRYAIKDDYAIIPRITGHGQSGGANNIAVSWTSNTPRNLGTVRVPLDNCLNNHFIFCFYSEKYNPSSANDYISTLSTTEGLGRDAPLFAKNLPDAALFVTSTLQNYSVGTGDGTTQDYTPPIPMWLDDSEKVYIDGVQQTRGVDYTCDSKHNLQKNIELMPLGQAFITDGYIVPNTYMDASNVYISSVYICASDLSYPQYGSPTQYYGQDIFLQSMAVHKDHIDRSQNKYTLCMDNTHPFIFDIADEICKEVDDVYLFSYYDNVMTKSNAISISLEASNDRSNWTVILSDVSAKGSSSQDTASRVPIADWAHYQLQSRVSYKYWRMSVIIKGMIGTGNRYHSLGFILMRNGSPLHFNTAPAADSVITMGCDINIPYKDDKHVIDVSAVITM